MTNVRAARREDLAQIVAIYNHYVRHSDATFDTEERTVAERTSWFESHDEVGPYRLLVAADDEAVLGYASSGPYRSHPAFVETVETSIYVSPASRRMGIGVRLYGALIDELRNEPVHVAVAGIGLPNDASVAFHGKLGFTSVGIFHEYAVVGGVYISSLWMERRV